MGMASIKIDENLLELIRQDAAVDNRSLAAQAAHYLAIGRAHYRSPDYDKDQVELALTGGIEVGELSLSEQTAFYEMWAQQMEKPGASHSFWEDRKARGLGVGETDDGKLERQLAGGGTAAYA